MVGIAPAGSNASEYLTWQEAQHYQAALSVDGFTSPDRLPFQMFTMSAIVKQVREAKAASSKQQQQQQHTASRLFAAHSSLCANTGVAAPRGMVLLPEALSALCARAPGYE